MQANIQHVQTQHTQSHIQVIYIYIYNLHRSFLNSLCIMHNFDSLVILYYSIITLLFSTVTTTVCVATLHTHVYVPTASTHTTHTSSRITCSSHSLFRLYRSLLCYVVAGKIPLCPGHRRTSEPPIAIFAV